MKKYNLKLECTVPDYINDEQFIEWLRYELIDWGSCSCNNPLLKNRHK